MSMPGMLLPAVFLMFLAGKYHDQFWPSSGVPDERPPLWPRPRRRARRRTRPSPRPVPGVATTRPRPRPVVYRPRPRPSPSPVRPVSTRPRPVLVRPTMPVSRPTPAATAPPWPQGTPRGLPAFPGPGWTPARPPSASVVARAHQLLPQLWRYGPGTRKCEQTGGQWIMFVATPMGSKRGVVAHRLVAPPVHTTTATPASATPSSPLSLRTLRRGSRGDDVKIVQRRLGIGDDGIFGRGTDAAVRKFQSNRGLKADGIVGRMTWAALLGKAA